MSSIRQAVWSRMSAAFLALVLLSLVPAPTLCQQPAIETSSSAQGVPVQPGDDAGPVAMPPNVPSPLDPTEFDTTPQPFKADELEVRSIAISPDGKRMAVGHGRWTTAGVVRVWNLETREELNSVHERRGVSSVAFSPDGQWLANATWDGAQVKLRDAATLDVRLVIRTGRVSRLAFSPDGKRLVTATEGSKLTLWDVESGQVVREFAGDLFRLYCVAFSPDGRHVAAGGGSFDSDRFGRLGIWDVESGQQRHVINDHIQPVAGVAFSPDSKRLASSSFDMTARLWDVQTGEPVRNLQGHESGALQSIAFSHDGKLLATTSYDSTTALWDAETGSLVASFPHDGRTISAVFTPDDQTLVSGGIDKLVRLLDVSTREQQAVLTPSADTSDPPDVALALAYSPDGRLVASAHEDKTVRLREAETGGVLAVLDGHADVVAGVAFSPDSKTLATASYDRMIKLWDVSGEANEREPRATLEGHANWVMSVAFSPDGRRLASGGYDRSIRLWDLESLGQLATLEGHSAAVRSVAFSPDGKRLVSGSSDRSSRVWNVESAKEGEQSTELLVALAGHQSTVRTTAFSPDGLTVATAGEDNLILLWDLNAAELTARTGDASPVPRATLSGHTGMVWTLAFSPGGSVLASGGLDGVVKLWNPQTGAERATLRGHQDVVTSLVFAPDASRLISASYDKSIHIWKAKGPPISVIAPLATIPGESESIMFVTFSPDGSLMATAGKNKRIVLRNVKDGEIAATLEGHETGVAHLAFSVNGKHLAAALHDGDVQVWDVAERQKKWLLNHAGGVRRVAFSPSGARLLSAGWDATAKLWDVESGKLIFTTPPQSLAVSCVAFSPDGAAFVTGTGNWRDPQQPGELKLWSVSDAKELAVIGSHQHEIKGVLFDSSGQRVVAHGVGSVLVWDVASRAPVATLLAGRTTTAAVLLDDDRLVLADTGGNVKLWSLSRQQPVAQYDGGASLVPSIAASPDGTLLVAIEKDGALRMWPLGSRSERLPGHAAWVTAAAFTPDGQRVITSRAGSNALQVFDVTTAELLFRFGATDQDRRPVTVAVSPDGRSALVGGYERTLRLWDLQTREPIRELLGHRGIVRSVRFLPEGKLALSGGDDRAVVLWDLETGKEVRRFRGHGGEVVELAISPDGRRFASAGEESVLRLWDIERETPLHVLPGHTAAVLAIAFSPDGTQLLSGSYDATIRLWDVASGRELDRLQQPESEPRPVTSPDGLRGGGQADWIRSVAFADDRHFLAGNFGGSIQVWDLETKAVVRTVRMHEAPVQTLTVSPDGKRVVSGDRRSRAYLWEFSTVEAAVDQVASWAASMKTADAGNREGN